MKMRQLIERIEMSEMVASNRWGKSERATVEAFLKKERAPQAGNLAVFRNALHLSGWSFNDKNMIAVWKDGKVVLPKIEKEVFTTQYQDALDYQAKIKPLLGDE